MSKLFGVFALAVFVLGSSVSASEVSKSTLNGMGLGSMTKLSDTDGLAIRGKGTFAYASGSGFANLPNAHQQSSYSAGSNHHSSSSFATGSNFNVVGTATQVGHISSFIVTGTIGGSTAFAK